MGSYAFGNCFFLTTANFQGNAPLVGTGAGSADNTVFYGASSSFFESGVVYYGGGKTGWGTTFGSWPAVCRTQTTPLSAFHFFTNNGTITITSYVGTATDVVVPSRIYVYPVTGIGNNAFSSNFTLNSVLLPNTVTSIGDQAFYLCLNLVSLPLPTSLTSIGSQAFTLSRGLTYMTIPSGVTNLGSGAFMVCASLLNISVAAGNPNYASLGGVLFDSAFTTLIQCPNVMSGNYIVPSTVTNIASNAFYIPPASINLTSVTIPNNVLSIGSSAFSQCNLQSFNVAADNPNYTSVGGVLFNKTLTTLIRGPAGLAGNYVIPNSVTRIGESAFRWAYALTSVTIPTNVTDIGDSAFWNCNGLTSMTIPNSVTNLGLNAFQNSDNLVQAYFLGNAPTVNGGAGNADTNCFLGETGTVFYQPGTTGWASTFGGWPTVAEAYQPQPQLLGAGPSGPSNSYNFTIAWATNAAVVVEASTNLQTWTPLSTNTLGNGSNTFTDADWTNWPQRFYRVRKP